VGPKFEVEPSGISGWTVTQLPWEASGGVAGKASIEAMWGALG